MYLPLWGLLVLGLLIYLVGRAAGRTSVRNEDDDYNDDDRPVGISDEEWRDMRDQMNGRPPGITDEQWRNIR